MSNVVPRTRTLVHYLLIIGIDSDTEVHIGETYRPALLYRFPTQNRDDYAFPPGCESCCCFPEERISVQSTWSPPRYFAFSLTNAESTQAWCLSLRFWEAVPNNDEVYAEKAVAIITEWPFVASFGRVLHHIYQQIRNSSGTRIPLESYVVNLLSETPVPPTGYTRVRINLLDASIPKSKRGSSNGLPDVPRPAQETLPVVDSVLLHRSPINKDGLPEFCLLHIFLRLPLDAVLLAFRCLCLDMSVLFIGETEEDVFNAALALTHLLFPLKWHRTFIPVLQRSAEVLITYPCAPPTGIYGITTKQQYSIMEAGSEEDDDEADPYRGLCLDAVVVDLVEGRVSMRPYFGDDGRPHKRSPDEIPELPARAGEKLHANLKAILADVRESGIRWKQGMLPPEFYVPLHSLRDPDDKNLHFEGLNEARERRVLDQDETERRLRFCGGSVHARAEEALKFTFLRFFTAILKGYSKSFSLTEGRPVFDSSRFLKTFKHDDHPFMEGLMQSTSFGKMMLRLVDPKESEEAGDFSPLFFDECIEAKKNRSRLQFNKLSTPFLDDTTFDITREYVTQPPAMVTLPQGGAFQYSHFPNMLTPSRIPKARPTPSLLHIYEKPLRTHALSLISDIRRRKRLMDGKSGVRILSDSERHLRMWEDQLAVLADREEVARLERIRDEKLRACVLLQSFARMRPCRHSYLQTRASAITAQAVVRMFLCARRYRRTRIAISRIQAFSRMVPNRARYRRIRKATILAQACVRRLRCRRVYLATVRNIIRLQAWWRAAVQRAAYVRCVRGIVRLQATARMRAVRKRYHSQRVAAIRIQVHVRMAKARRTYLLQLRAAIKIQSWFRMVRDRRQYTRLRTTTIMAQALCRMRQQRYKFQRTLSDVRLLQSTMRMAIARKHFLHQLRSIIVLQARMRGFVQRRRYVAQVKGITRLQAHVRRYHQRRRYLSTVAKVVLCQAMVRRFIAVQRFRRWRTAALIQSAIRGYLARRHLQRDLWAAILPMWEEVRVCHVYRSRCMLSWGMAPRLGALKSLRMERKRLSMVLCDNGGKNRKVSGSIATACPDLARAKHRYHKTKDTILKVFRGIDTATMAVLYQRWHVPSASKQRKRALLHQFMTDATRVPEAGAILDAVATLENRGGAEVAIPRSDAQSRLKQILSRLQ
eukprot:Rmarinus@m.25506